ncbi:MAG TPA: hypothetical protein VFQ16_12185 [Burkholderiaceae bacterium]|nr:hypothetical protein [Burkholderiaceae bacterium]
MSLEGLAGRLRLCPQGTPAVVCERPMVGAALLGRLTSGRRAVLLPDLLAGVFSLCADAQRSTARRAVKAALGFVDGEADAVRDRLALSAHVAREHLQRFALDLPAHTGSRGDVGWMRDAPVTALPAITTGPGEQALRHALHALPGWLERRLFGQDPAAWLAGWQAEGGAWLARWCSASAHPVARWLAQVQGSAHAAAWHCRALDLLDDPQEGLREVAAALRESPAFAERPLWQGAPAETGPWTRQGADEGVYTAWDRLGARLAELAALAGGQPLALGALTLDDGEGIAWTEMSRGLLVHWCRLEPGERDPGTARVARYLVIAPTEWNFHPEGLFARWLQDAARPPAHVHLAAAALDPCVAFTVQEAGDA